MKYKLSAIVTIFILVMASGCGASGGEENGGDNDSSVIDSAGFQRIEPSRFGFFRGGGSYPYMQELGAHWQRAHPGPFVWGSIESERGKYDWSEADAFVSETQDHEVLIDATIWPYANWDQEQCHEKLPNAPVFFMPTLGDYRGKPCDMDSYGAFIRALVERYDGDGDDDMPGLVYPVKYWEVINEPELDNDTPFFASDSRVEDYREMLVTTAAAIRESDSGANTLTAGIATLEGEALGFWESVLGGDGKVLVDVLTIHAVLATPEKNMAALGDMMGELGLSKPVWVTEIRTAHGQEIGGHEERSRRDTGDEGGARDESAPTTEEVAEQERWSAEMVRQFVAGFGEGADKLFYMGLDNSTPTAEAARLVNCGEVVGGELEEDHLQLSDCVRQKPFYAFRTMVDMLDYFDAVEKIAPGQYLFTVDGKEVYVLWGNESLPSGIVGTVMSTDIYGEQSRVDAGAVRLTDIPLYIENLPSGG